MPPGELLPMLLEPGAVIVILAALAYGFYSGRIVRGSEHTQLKEKYETLVALRIEELEERARTTPALAEIAERRQREIDDYIRSRKDSDV